VSQFYFQQAFNNVIFGPWKRIADGYGKMVLGYFGKPPVPADAEVVAIAQEQLGLTPTKEDPRLLNDADPTKGVDAARARLVAAHLPVTDENIFIAASLLDKGIAFLKGNGEVSVRKNLPDSTEASTSVESNSYAVTVNDRTYNVVLDGGKATVNGHDFAVDVAKTNEPSAKQTSPTPSVATTDVRAELPGKVVRVSVKEGDTVDAGDTLLVLEALKMEIEVKSPVGGTVAQLAVAADTSVAAGDLLVAVG
jgi:pyruvate carboxylase subunit B